jgi:hypothetical protein
MRFSSSSTESILRQRLDELAPASPELLGRRELLNRNDAKFCLPMRHLPALLGSAVDAYDILLSAGSTVATYDTLYFDSAELQCFHDHRRGRRHRAKIRIRHYPDRQLSFFEVKAKSARGSTNKARVARVFGDDELGEADRALVRRGFPSLADRIEPVLWTRFARITLLGRETAERATIDINLRFEACTGISRAFEGLSIVEVKQPRLDRRTPLMCALRELRAMPSAMSKYCSGVVALGLSQHANVFAARVRAMTAVAS